MFLFPDSHLLSCFLIAHHLPAPDLFITVFSNCLLVIRVHGHSIEDWIPGHSIDDTFWCKECVPLAISYHLYFLRISKVQCMLHHESVERVQSKERYYMFTYTFWLFLLFFIKKICAFIIFILFLLKKYQISATEY